MTEDRFSNYSSFPETMNAEFVIDMIEGDTRLSNARMHIYDTFYKKFNIRSKFNNQNNDFFEQFKRGVRIQINNYIKSFQDLYIISDELIERGFTLKYEISQEINGRAMNKHITYEELNPIEEIPKFIIISIDNTNNKSEKPERKLVEAPKKTNSVSNNEQKDNKKNINDNEIEDLIRKWCEEMSQDNYQFSILNKEQNTIYHVTKNRLKGPIFIDDSFYNNYGNDDKNGNMYLLFDNNGYKVGMVTNKTINRNKRKMLQVIIGHMLNYGEFVYYDID